MKSRTGTFKSNDPAQNRKSIYKLRKSIKDAERKFWPMLDNLLIVARLTCYDSCNTIMLPHYVLHSGIFLLVIVYDVIVLMYSMI